MTEQVLQLMRLYAKQYNVPVLFDETSEFICSYIKEHDVKSVLEIGTAIAFSTIQFACAKEDVHVTSIEIDVNRYCTAQKNVFMAGLADRITLLHDNALTCDLKNQKFDLIFIDAAKSQYLHFFERYKDNLNEGGVIVSDNLFFHGMVEDLSLTHNYSTKKLVKKIRKYVLFLKSNTEFDTEFFNCGDGISVSRRHS
ncbi:MAG TPA: SAM-dependent methyltransferase [Treponema sp.]|nr:SAM-dependent methyltransferase [Treponema sp.]